MARAPTTTDAFAAIAEPRRRRILGLLAGTDGYRDVTWLVDQLGWPQPQVSKHLGVLRQVGLVNVMREGKHRKYALNGAALRPIYDWAKSFERFWEHQLQRIKDRAERMERGTKAKG
jgi:DNA-binding transcriptional ArsR family regulator